LSRSRQAAHQGLTVDHYGGSATCFMDVLYAPPPRPTVSCCPESLQQILACNLTVLSISLIGVDCSNTAELLPCIIMSQLLSSGTWKEFKLCNRGSLQQWCLECTVHALSRYGADLIRLSSDNSLCDKKLPPRASRRPHHPHATEAWTQHPGRRMCHSADLI